jgi:hypothetical protein
MKNKLNNFYITKENTYIPISKLRALRSSSSYNRIPFKDKNIYYSLYITFDNFYVHEGFESIEERYKKFSDILSLVDMKDWMCLKNMDSQDLAAIRYDQIDSIIINEYRDHQLKIISSFTHESWEGAEYYDTESKRTDRIFEIGNLIEQAKNGS